MLIPEDFVSPRNLSGYRYVVPCGGGHGWQASRNGGGRRDGWRGPMRTTPFLAIQDYCNYMNGLPTPPRKVLKTANHPTRRKGGKKVPPEVAAAYGVIRDHRARENARAKNYVYLMGEWGAEYVKIGESAKPPARPGECQTGNPRKLVLLAYYEVSVLRGADKTLHQQFAGDHEQNEWFYPTDAILSHFKVTRKELLRRCGGKATKGAKQPA